MKEGRGGGGIERQRESETEICIFFHKEWFPSLTKLIVVMVHCVHGYSYIQSYKCVFIYPSFNQCPSYPPQLSVAITHTYLILKKTLPVSLSS